MNPVLENIIQDYQSAEFTCMFLHDKKNDKKINLLSVIELNPFEQQPSLMIGDKSTGYMQRETVNDDFTIYITRIIGITPNEAIEKYERIEKGFNLTYDTLCVDIEIPYLIEQEPPNYNPLLIELNEEKTIGRILPKRNTAFRVWSKQNINKDWLKDFDNKFFDRISILSRNYLNYDLSSIPEHIGNIYLCACNPLLRNWETTLLDKNSDLLISFFERDTKSILGCKLIIEEERSKHNGFTIIKEITNKRERIELPYFPDALRKKIYDRQGNLLENSFGVFRNIQFSMNVQESVLNLKVQTNSGEEIYSIPKTSQVSTTTVGKYDLTIPHYLRDALNDRKFEELEKNKEFIFFQKSEESKKIAQKAIRELLNKAVKRCVILDPYFGAQDLIYAFTVQNISIPIQIISSASFLSSEIENNNTKKKNIIQKLWRCVLNSFCKKKKEKTQAFLLHRGINDYKTQYPLQKIECRVLRGKKSPLHDRYIIVDDIVYLLGSSLNEFGSRATTIIKVPTPKKMIEQAEEWWGNEDVCPTLVTYLQSINQ